MYGSFHDLRPAHYTKKWIRRLRQYPDQLRMSVIPSILPLVLFIAVYTYCISVAYIKWGWTQIAVSNSIVPVLSVVLGLLLTFRANTSYARYYEGRQLWQDIISNTRNLARLLWTSIPERTDEDHLEKMRCMKLLLAFAISTKHYLRREYGIDYYDLDYLLPPHWVPAAADDEDEHTETQRDDQSAHLRNLSVSDRSLTETMRASTSSLLAKKAKEVSRFVHDEDLPDEGESDMSLPLEIIFRLSLYMAQAQTSAKIDSTFANVIITHLNNLNDALAGMERIVNTPIPPAYVVHLKQSLALYLIAVPFTLIAQLEWWLIPTMFLASFILLGIDAIGAQIENPFGYNSNDLPLNAFCDSLRQEIEFIIYHLPCETSDGMMTSTLQQIT
ncbi:Bestrophin/UPF0187 [Pilobolus umbonatus]|nr:Bestrophin/UPF0187 [Pilobolus umbonatus]